MMFERTTLLAVAAGLATTSAIGQTYHVTDLGTLGGLGDTQAFGLARTGNRPLVVGFATLADHGLRGFINQGQGMEPISPIAPDTQSVAYGVDGLGRAVGTMFQLGVPDGHAFRTGADGAIDLLGTFTARGVNLAGRIVGYRPSVETVGLAGELLFDRAVMFDDASGAGVIADLGTLATSHWSRAYAVNDSGLIAGCSGRADDSGSRAVVWISGGTSAGIHDLGVIGGTEGGAYSLNNSGQVVGYSTRGTTPEVRTAAIWQVDSTGAVTSRIDLGTLPTAGAVTGWAYAYGVNDQGKAVGTSSGRGFLHEHGSMIDLNSVIPPGWYIVAGRAINDSDAIAAWGVNSTNEPRALLLSRCDADFGRDGEVSVQDLFDFLGAYFANAARADINHDGGVGVQDIFDYLALWFEGC